MWCGGRTALAGHSGKKWSQTRWCLKPKRSEVKFPPLAEGVKQVPGKESVAAFLSGYFVGRSAAEIAWELGVSREWCSRNYRREALTLTGMQFGRGILGKIYVGSKSDLSDFPLTISR